MIDPDSWLALADDKSLPWLVGRTILLVRHGSHAYGLDTPESDIDLRGVAVPPAAYFHGFHQRFEQAIRNEGELDLTIFDIRKFCALAADANPSILEIAWVDSSDVLHCSAAGRKLLAARELFLSRKAKYTYSGYAHSQMKRIERHRRWLTDPPEVGSDQWDAYSLWRQGRSGKRRDIERTYGYDTKHAMHLVRLMKTGIRLLRDGVVEVRREGDRDELLAIRNGAWPFERLVEWFAEKDSEMQVAHDSSSLRRSADRVKIDQVCQEIVEASL